MKTAIVFWSGTGNTEAMAEYIKAGAVSAGGNVSLIAAADFSAESVNEYDTLAFGCPAMGSEELESGEFEPMFESVRGSLAGKRIALFGSYGWGDGEWMRSWEESCLSADAQLVADSVICCNAPEDDSVIDACKALGAALVQ